MTDTHTPDAYEARFMSGEGEVILREKMGMPGVIRVGLPAFMVAMGVLMLFVIPALAFSIPFALLMFGSALLTFLLTTLRVSVTSEQVNVQNGPFGPQIPIDAIASCEAVSYDAVREYGGWGIRKGTDGTTVYNMLGDAGKGVRIHYTTPAGETKKVLFSSRRHHLTAETINRLREERGHDVADQLTPADEDLGLEDPFEEVAERQEPQAVEAQK